MSNSTTGNSTGHHNYTLCTGVTPDCPVEATIYGYYPNLGANIFFCVIFGLLALVHFALGLRYRCWAFMVALGVGCVGECIGYVGRILLNNNPWSDTGFEMQICCLIIAPAFMAAGVYLTLKHFALAISPSLSPLKPRLYTWIFIGCDLLSLILQGAGGGTAATATDDHDKQKVGNDLMMAGIVWQVITLLFFAITAGVYFSRVASTIRRGDPNGAISPRAHALLARPMFQCFCAAVLLAFVTIFTRCVYRIAEMANGWSNHIMQNEVDFIVLDGVMITIATLALTLFHPAWGFPEMQAREYGKDGYGGSKSNSPTREKVIDLESSSPESSPERPLEPVRGPQSRGRH